MTVLPVKSGEKHFVLGLAQAFAKSFSQEQLEAIYQDKLPSIAKSLNSKLGDKVPANAVVFVIYTLPVVFISYKSNGIWDEPTILQDNTDRLNDLVESISDDVVDSVNTIRDLTVSCALASLSVYSCTLLFSPNKSDSVSDEQKASFTVAIDNLKQALDKFVETLNTL